MPYFTKLSQNFPLGTEEYHDILLLGNLTSRATLEPGICRIRHSSANLSPAKLDNKL